MNEDEQVSRIVGGKPEGNRPLGRLSIDLMMKLNMKVWSQSEWLKRD
jgi:hypothetical protein